MLSCIPSLFLLVLLAASLAVGAPAASVSSTQAAPLSIQDQQRLLYVVSKRVAPDLPQAEILTFLAGDIPNSKVSELMAIAASNSTDPVVPPAPTAVRGRQQLSSWQVNRISGTAHFASMAYCAGTSGELLETMTCGPKCQGPLVKNVKILKVISQGASFAFVAARPATRELIISIRGTSNKQNEADNMNLTLINWPYARPHFGPAGRVHAGFTNVYAPLREQLLLAIHQARRNRVYCDYTLVFTGHSLGGAVATMAAVDVYTQRLAPAHRIGVMTFGSPRVGDLTFSNAAASSGFLFNERVVNGNDVVAAIPSRASGYVHAGVERYFLGQGKAYLCNGAEDPACSMDRIPYVSYMSHILFNGSQKPFFGQFGCRG